MRTQVCCVQYNTYFGHTNIFVMLLTIDQKQCVWWTISSVAFVDYLTNEAHMWCLDTILLDIELADNSFLINTGSFENPEVIHKN